MRPVEAHSKLSALWLSVTLNIVFRNLHRFAMAWIIAIAWLRVPTPAAPVPSPEYGA